MGTILRSALIYVALIVIFRLMGKRSLAQVTTFDLVLILIISEATQQAILGEDGSLTNALLVILTLVGLDVVLASWKQRSDRLSRICDGLPILLVQDGELHHDRMDKERVDVAEILQAAREAHGLERMDEIKHAILEPSGGITIVPYRR